MQPDLDSNPRNSTSSECHQRPRCRRQAVRANTTFNYSYPETTTMREDEVGLENAKPQNNLVCCINGLLITYHTIRSSRPRVSMQSTTTEAIVTQPSSHDYHTVMATSPTNGPPASCHASSSLDDDAWILMRCIYGPTGAAHTRACPS